MRIISVWNDKGGMGKTTLALLLGSALATSGKNVLLVDNDPSHMLSDRVTLKKSSIKEGLDHYYSGKKAFLNILTDTYIENLFLIPAGFELSDFYVQSGKKVIRKMDDLFNYFRLDKKFTETFDYVILDNPPADRGIAMHCNLLSDIVVMPVAPDNACYEALERSYTLIQEQAENFEDKLIVIVPSLVFLSRKQQNEVLKKIAKNYSGRNKNTIVTKNVVKNRAEIQDFFGNKLNFFVSYGSSDTAQELMGLCTEILPWIDKKEFVESIKSYNDKRKAQRRLELLKIARNNKKLKDKELANAS